MRWSRECVPVIHVDAPKEWALMRWSMECVPVIHVDAPTEWALMGVSGRLQTIVKHRFWGIGTSVNCAKTGVDNLNYLYTVYDAFVCK